METLVWGGGGGGIIWGLYQGWLALSVFKIWGGGRGERMGGVLPWETFRIRVKYGVH